MKENLELDFRSNEFNKWTNKNNNKKSLWKARHEEKDFWSKQKELQEGLDMNLVLRGKQ